MRSNFFDKGQINCSTDEKDPTSVQSRMVSKVLFRQMGADQITAMQAIKNAISVTSMIYTHNKIEVSAFGKMIAICWSNEPSANQYFLNIMASWSEQWKAHCLTLYEDLQKEYELITACPVCSASC